MIQQLIEKIQKTKAPDLRGTGSDVKLYSGAYSEKVFRRLR